MIITQYKGKRFGDTLRYVTQKTGARLLGHNLFCSSVEEQNAAMVAVAEQSERVKKPMMHYAISLSPGERLTIPEWRSLTQQYMREMGYTDNQYLLVRHTDTPHHDHVHLVINRVQRISGRVVSLDWDYYQSQALVRRLEKQFNLSSVRSSWEPFVERLPGEDVLLLSLPPEVQHRQAAKEQIREVLNQSLLLSQNLGDFIGLVERRGVTVELQERQGKLKGIAFSCDNERFAGSKLGPGYSLPKLMKAWQDAAISEGPVGPVEEPFHQRYYWELVEMVEGRLGDGLSTQQKDFQLAMLALRSSKPDAGKALGYSPDIQRLSREQGEQAARDYLRQLLEAAQQRLREIDREKQARMDQEQKSRRGQQER